MRINKKISNYPFALRGQFPWKAAAGGGGYSHPPDLCISIDPILKIFRLIEILKNFFRTVGGIARPEAYVLALFADLVHVLEVIRETGFIVRMRQLICRMAKQPGFTQLAKHASCSERLSVSEIADRAKQITDQFKTHILIEIVDTVADIPGHAKSTAVASSATTNDHVYLIREGLGADNFEITLFHEKLSSEGVVFC